MKKLMQVWRQKHIYLHTFIFHYNNNIVLIVATSVWWADASLAASRNFSVSSIVLLRQINLSLFLSKDRSMFFCLSASSHEDKGTI